MLQFNSCLAFTRLPGIDIAGVIFYNAWGTARKGDSSVGESDFIEDGPQVAITEVMVDLFGSLVPLDLSRCSSDFRKRMEKFVFDMVGRSAIEGRLWESQNCRDGCPE